MEKSDDKKNTKKRGIIHPSTEKELQNDVNLITSRSDSKPEEIGENLNLLTWSSKSSDFFKGKRLWGLNTGRGLVQKKYCHRQINALLEIIPKEYFGKDNHIFYDYLCYTFRRCLSESKTLILLAEYDKTKETGTNWKPCYVHNNKTPVLILWDTGLKSKDDDQPLYCALAPYIDQSEGNQKKTKELYLQFFHKKSNILDQDKLKDIIGVHIFDFVCTLLETQNQSHFKGKIKIPAIKNEDIPQQVCYIDDSIDKDLLIFNPNLSISTLDLKSRSDLQLSKEQLNVQLNCNIKWIF